MKPLLRDPIIEEVREVKRRLAEKFDYDVRAMLKDAQRRQTRSGRTIITLSRRKPS